MFSNDTIFTNSNLALKFRHCSKTDFHTSDIQDCVSVLFAAFAQGVIYVLQPGNHIRFYSLERINNPKYNGQKCQIGIYTVGREQNASLFTY